MKRGTRSRRIREAAEVATATAAGPTEKEEGGTKKKKNNNKKKRESMRRSRAEFNISAVFL